MRFPFTYKSTQYVPCLHIPARCQPRPALQVWVSEGWGMFFSLFPEKWLQATVAAVRNGAVPLQPRARTEIADRSVSSFPGGTIQVRADSIVTTDDEQALVGKRYQRLLPRRASHPGCSQPG
jgi:hypothetical protein